VRNSMHFFALEISDFSRRCSLSLTISLTFFTLIFVSERSGILFDGKWCQNDAGGSFS
jgi:hypothetical protein